MHFVSGEVHSGLLIRFKMKSLCCELKWLRAFLYVSESNDLEEMVP